MAQELDISLRTLYRDIAALQAQGAHIEGEPGVGYVLRPGYMLPPLMLSQEELEALVLGTRWVADRGDARLGEAAQNALTKIVAVLPKDMADEIESSGLLIPPSHGAPEGKVDLSEVRQAIRTEQTIHMNYIDLKSETTERTVWPIALGFFDHVRLLIGWCELRNDFRSFRTDRILKWQPLGQRYPKRRAVLLKQWKAMARDSLRPVAAVNPAGRGRRSTFPVRHRPAWVEAEGNPPVGDGVGVVDIGDQGVGGWCDLEERPGRGGWPGGGRFLVGLERHGGGSGLCFDGGPGCRVASGRPLARGLAFEQGLMP